jgi:hypothetical protein
MEFNQVAFKSTEYTKCQDSIIKFPNFNPKKKTVMNKTFYFK